MESTEIKREERRFVVQPDSASCGVCLCMIVQMICDKLENDVKVDNLLWSEDVSTFRNWMPYAMYCKAVKYSPRFHMVEERAVMAYLMGLYSIGNTCWFNSVIQAISCISKRHNI